MFSGRSLIYKRNKIGPKTRPRGTPDVTGISDDFSPSNRITYGYHESKQDSLQMTNWRAPIEGYQTGSFSQASWQRIPVTNCTRKEAELIVMTGGRDLPEFQGVLGSCS